MEEICHICGAIGVEDALVICSQCKTSIEHLYCMRTCFEEYPDYWLCEDCEHSSKSTTQNSYLTNSAQVHNVKVWSSNIKNLPSESKRSSYDWGKKAATRKTKYIPVNEVIMLSSGANKSFAPLKREKTRSPGIHHNMKYQTDRSKENIEGILKKSREVHKSINDVQHSQAIVNERMQNEKPANYMVPNRKVRFVMDKDENAASPGSPRINSTAGMNFANVEKRNFNTENGFEKLEKCLTTPALDALWKGRFSICSNPDNCRLSDIIQAHPPSRVRRRIYNFTKIMPLMLKFELVPCERIWIYLFKEYCPNTDDIGLYFFPDDKERTVDYPSFLETLNLKKLALRKQIDGIELLVFTSALLRRDCQKWEGKYFLWGVFHQLARDSSVFLDKRNLKLSVPSPDHCDDADMEVDMIGGIDVDRLDVRRKPRTSLNKKSNAASLPGASSKIYSDSKLLRVPIKADLYDVCPPGFEDIYRVRAKDNRTAKNHGTGMNYDGCGTCPISMERRFESKEEDRDADKARLNDCRRSHTHLSATGK